MNSRERVLKAINHKEADRVPIDVGGTLATSMHRIIYHKLKEKFNIRDDKEEILELALQSVILDKKILKKLHGDVVGLYSKPPKSWKMKINPEDNSYIDEWGIKYKPTRDNIYFDMVEHAFQNVTSADIDKYNWPDPYDKSRFEGVEEKARYFYEIGRAHV